MLPVFENKEEPHSKTLTTRKYSFYCKLKNCLQTDSFLQLSVDFGDKTLIELKRAYQK